MNMAWATQLPGGIKEVNYTNKLNFDPIISTRVLKSNETSKDKALSIMSYLAIIGYLLLTLSLTELHISAIERLAISVMMKTVAMRLEAVPRATLSCNGSNLLS